MKRNLLSLFSGVLCRIYFSFTLVVVSFSIMLFFLSVVQKTSQSKKETAYPQSSFSGSNDEFFCYGKCKVNGKIRTNQVLSERDFFDCERLELKGGFTSKQQTKRNRVTRKTGYYPFSNFGDDVEYASFDFSNEIMRDFCRQNGEGYIFESRKKNHFQDHFIRRKIKFCTESPETVKCTRLTHHPPYSIEKIGKNKKLLLDVGIKPERVYPNVLEQMTEIESLAFEKLKTYSKNLQIYKNNHKLSKFLENELVYFRFLSSKNFDLVTSKKHLEQTLRWRVDFKPEEITLKSLEFLKHPGLMLIPYGYDKQGHPVIYLWLKNLENIENDSDGSKKVSLFCYFLEYLFTNDLFPKGRFQFTYVVDVSGIGLSWIRTAREIGKSFREFGDNYPESIYKAHIVNAKWTLRGIFKIIKSFMNQGTKKKFSMNKGYSNLKSFIDNQYLLKEFGGNVKLPEFNYHKMVKIEQKIKKTTTY